MQFIDLLAHVRRFDLPTIITGLLALAILIGLARTWFATLASVVALLVPSLLVALLGWEGVQRVVDVSPSALPVVKPTCNGKGDKQWT